MNNKSNKSSKIKKIIFIITDTLRAQNVGLYGADPSPTPNIDALGNTGVVFKNAYASITKTDPSVTSIMAGKYPQSIGLVNHGRYITADEEKNLENVTFLPEILKQSGWKTAAIDWFSRWHNKGYDYYSDRINKTQNRTFPIFSKLSLRSYLRILDTYLIKIIKRDFIGRTYFSLYPTPRMPYYDPANIVVDKAIEVLNKNPENKLFLYIHLWDAHAPYTRSKGLKSYIFDNIEKAYINEIKFLDQELGRLFNHLKDSDEMDDTLIILTSDHGENFSEHDTPLNHEGLYEDVVKIPLIFKHSSLLSTKVESLTQHIDILPTILDLLNINKPKNVDGISLIPIGEKRKAGSFLFFEDIPIRHLKIEKKYRRRAIRRANYKYIETYDLKWILNGYILSEEAIPIKKELYNLKTDPKEIDNIITKNKEIAIKLQLELNNASSSLITKRLQNNSELKSHVDKSIHIIRKASQQFKNKELAIAWKGGKDTTTMMHIIKILYGRIPFKVFFNDTTLEFKETYEFIEKMTRLWDLDLVVIKHDDKELKEYHGTKDLERKIELSRLMKITAINKAIEKYKFKGFMLGIRRDENPARAKEKYFSKRPDHIRIHPMLDWTEEDIWNYINLYGVSYNDLYDSGYRSIGEKPFTARSTSNERSGRDQDKEHVMERLRKLGYW